MLWRLDHMEKYFLGSFHILPESDAEIDARIRNLLPRMSRVVFECDISQGKEPRFARYQDGSKLYAHIPADLYAKCLQRWHELDIKTDLDSCKPWWAGLQIFLGIALKNGFSGERGVDQQLFAEVPTDRRVYLEHPDMAFVVFEQAPASEQIQYLNVSCLGEEMILVQLMSFYKAWRTSDLQALSKYLDDCMAIVPSIYGAMVNGRNHQWAPAISRYLKDPQPTLFVLGALHYVGPARFPDCLNASRKYEFRKVC